MCMKHAKRTYLWFKESDSDDLPTLQFCDKQEVTEVRLQVESEHAQYELFNHVIKCHVTSLRRSVLMV